MLRTSRTIASLVRCLMLGTAATVAAATLTTSVVSCGFDESQPEYWVEKLEDTNWRPRAIKRLEQFFEDAITRANKDMKNPEVRALLDKISDPLTKTYVDYYSDLDTKTRVSLIKLLAAFRDKRTQPALKKALESFIKKPTTNKDDTDIRWVIRAQGDLNLPALSTPMLEVFTKVKAHSPLGALVIKDQRDAMLRTVDKAWAPTLRKLLQPEIKALDPKDKNSLGAVKNQVYLQTVAALLLGEIRDTEAVTPLIKVLLDPLKGNVATTAVLALVKIGKPAVDAAIKLLRSADKELVQYHLAKVKAAQNLKEAPKNEPHLQMAAVILGVAGSHAAIKPMIDVINSTQQEANKAVIAAEMTKIPVTAQSKAAFKAVYEGLKLSTRIPRGDKALEYLTQESVLRFYDPDMVDWLLERAEATKGYPDERKDYQAQVLQAVLKLAKPDQIGKVRRALSKYGTKSDKKSKHKYFESPLFNQAEKLLKACGDRTECYLSHIEKGEVQKKENQFTGIKSAYMIGIYGDESAAVEIVDRLDSIENAAIQFSSVQALDHLLPKGSKKIADRLDEIIEKHRKSADKSKMQGDMALREVMYRLRARGGG
jgi:HEAT repeat protein